MWRSYREFPVWLASMGGYWCGAGLILFRRWRSPTVADLLVIALGFPVAFVLVTPLVGHLVLKVMGW